VRPHLATLLDDFRSFGNQTAVVRYVGNRRRVASYAAVARLAGRFAALLAVRGIEPGERVVLWGENGAEWIAAFYGCMLRGAIAVPLDAYGTAEFAERVAADVRPVLIVGDAALLAGLQGDWPRLEFEAWADSLPEEEAQPVPGLSHETPLQILFTSGTTGEPKGIVHTHGNVLASIEPIEQAAQGYMRYERLVHPLRFLHTLPLSHVFGQTMGLWMPPIFAAEVHFESRLTGARLVETARRERISVLAAVPRVLAMLKSHLEAEFPDLPARITASRGISGHMGAAKRWWRFRDIHSAFGFKFWAFITGGGALPGPVEEFWNALAFVLVQGYGMTETAALITLNHPFKVARGTLGKPLPGREVKLGPDGEVLVRGAMISPATWSAGALHERADAWLATGDLARADATGELRFIGRKSETIVTAAGVNIHPEDIEAVLDQEPEIAACAVVPVPTPRGAEACAVMALRGSRGSASAIVQRANTRLAEFQRIRRWAVWPEPDLPHTSTGKVRRATVAAWAKEQQSAGASPANPSTLDADWLLALIAGVTGEAIEADLGTQDEVRLSEDLRIDSLGRIQLLESLEHRMGVALDQDQYDRVETLAELRELVSRPGVSETGTRTATLNPSLRSEDAAGNAEEQPVQDTPLEPPETARQSSGDSRRKALHFVYPQWPWWQLFRWFRAVFVECVMRPFVWFLASPHVVRVGAIETLATVEPMLIVANHVTSFDVPLLLYALPQAIRDRNAVAMSGEMLEDFRHARGLDPGILSPLGPAAWLLMTAFFNVFPLPRKRDFQRSFAHAGQALDRGFHIVIFPEGTRSPEGKIASFRPGIGLLVKQSHAAVLPMALFGLGDLKAKGKGWFRSEKIEVRVGEAIPFSAMATEAEITARLHTEVTQLLNQGVAQR